MSAELDQTLAHADYMPSATSLGTTWSDAFSTAYDAAQRNDSSWSSMRNVSSAVQDHLDYVESKGYGKVGNPYANFATDPQAPAKAANTVQFLSELAQKNGDPTLAMPYLETLQSQGVDKARAASRLAEQQPGLLSGGSGPYEFGAGIAGLAGGLWAGSTDPSYFANTVLSMAAVPVGGPVAVQALRTAIGFGAGQLATTIDTDAYKREVTPERGFGDAAREVAGAAALGAGSSLAGAGLAALWRRVRSTSPSVAATIPQPLRDAGNVAERHHDIDANNPFQTGLTGAQAHRDAITQMSADLAQGKVPTLPAHVADEARLVPQGEHHGIGDVIDRAVVHEHPEVQSIVAAVNDAAPEWKTMRRGVETGDIPAMHDPTPAIGQAMHAIMEAKETGVPVSEVLTQGKTFYSDQASQAARMFYKDGDLDGAIASKAEITNNLKSYANVIRGVDRPAVEPRPAALGEHAAGLAREAMKIETKPEAVHQAMATSLQRNIDQGRNRVPVETEGGGSSLGWADKELAGIHSQEALAREVANCATGAAT